MPSKSIFFAQVLSAVFSVGCAYSAYYPMALCKATVVDHQVQSTLTDCVVPTNYLGSLNSGPSEYVDSLVPRPAELNAVDVNWFLNADGCPAINVTITATSQGPMQDYTIHMLTDVTPTPVFCGRILTKQLSGDNPGTHTFGVEIRCPAGILKHSAKIFVPVHVKGKEPVVTEYMLPSCEDPTMAQSNKCTAEEKKHIHFLLRQDKNSTVVILNMKSAYTIAQPTSSVFVMIQEKTDSDVARWKSNRPPVQLFWPERTTEFKNVSMGQTYQVLVWRPRELTRYSGRITMRADHKEESSYFFRTIAKRRAMRMQREREEARIE